MWLQLKDPKNDFNFNFDFDNKMKNLWTVWISRKIHKKWYFLKNFKAVLVVSCSLWAEHILSWATLTYQGPAEICWAQWIKTKIIVCRPLCSVGFKKAESSDWIEIFEPSKFKLFKNSLVYHRSRSFERSCSSFNLAVKHVPFIYYILANFNKCWITMWIFIFPLWKDYEM